MKSNRKHSTVILLLLFFIGLSVMLYPAVSSYWNSRTQSKAIVDYEKILESMPDEDYTSQFEAAEEYNRRLLTLDYPLMEYGELDGYRDILDVSGTGIIGYITVEKIGLELPVYHGTAESVLNTAVGHLEGTSLPIGGTGTHAVVSAHRGLPTAKLFTDLDRLEVGDTFTFKVLDCVLTYQVDQVKTVDPADTAELRINKDRDYLTLLTCTPYGINTHRLLVRGVRIETVENKVIHITSDAHRIEPLIVTPVVALPILFTLMITVLFKPVKKDVLDEE